MKKQALERLSRAKEALGEGIWHEDSSYEIAGMDIKLWEARLEEINKELRELKKGPSDKGR